MRLLGCPDSFGSLFFLSLLAWLLVHLGTQGRLAGVWRHNATAGLSVPRRCATANTLNPRDGGALSDVLFNPKYAGSIYKVTVAVDFLGNILWVCPLSPGTTPDVLIWDREGFLGSNVAVCCRSVGVQLGGESWVIAPNGAHCVRTMRLFSPWPVSSGCGARNASSPSIHPSIHPFLGGGSGRRALSPPPPRK